MNPIKVTSKPRKCHKCDKTTVVKILYGMPTEEAFKLLEQEKKIMIHLKKWIKWFLFTGLLKQSLMMPH